MADDTNKQKIPLEDPVLAGDSLDKVNLADILKGKLDKQEVKEEQREGNKPIPQGSIFQKDFTPPVRFGLKLQNEAIRELTKRLLVKYDAEKVISILFEIDEAVEKGVISNEYIYMLYTDASLLDDFEKNLGVED